MSTATPADRRVTSEAPPVAVDRPKLRPLDLLILSAWCGLAGGLLEVATLVCARNLIPTTRGYLMSRHFLWLAPIVEPALLRRDGIGPGAGGEGYGREPAAGSALGSSASWLSCRC